ncbi:hypothetical protein CC85DRAFT_285578 [Cutaneotrichosporon oleaginosum]|uniref:Uncharacterized protein n=1 Tax=Cutaneotrichosporon oleaginosum TaxID=879819 RepID=A0A0J0XML9_9TREE|nr:uncharacterized protein CC85DRAFT_285578 [Cutaneotrichosporon oleaginosum]KLT42337.1 hypothetical protein CC85DRAFT_285578 [Cutaneotrichosporon oleaginosum]TXT04157.1 hypothetical protein COLE_07854 [Cutaneotrichosporon oleaginosum]
MAPAIPIIIGTTIAVAATGYAFKKFVYDPHLAPVIEAFIEQQRELHNRRHRRAVPVPSQQEERVEGRSTAVASGHAYRRRPAEQYELDESMVETHRAPVSYTPRRRKPVPPLDEDAPFRHERNATPEPAPMSGASSAAPPDEAVPLIVMDKDVPYTSPPVPAMENPFADSESPSSAALSPTISSVHSLPSDSPAPSHSTLIEAPSSPDMSSDIDIVSVSGTNTSYIDAESYTPGSLSPNATGSVASRGASRPLSPVMAGSELAFPSPVTPVAASMLGSDLTFPAPNSTHRQSAPTSTHSPRPDDVLSVSSWTEDEWRSEAGADSEWDAVSEPPSR